MRLLVAASIFLLPHVCYAQEASLPSRSPSDAAVYHLDLTADDVRLIGASLAEQPYKVVAPVIAKLQSQVAAQLAAAKLEPPARTALPVEPVPPAH